MKRFLVLIFFAAAGLNGRAQGLYLFSDERPLFNGAEIVQSGRSDTTQLITWLHIVNVSGHPMQILMKKEDVSLIPGASSSICWAGYCYDSSVTVSVFPLSLVAGDTSSGCFGHFAPRGGRGESVVRWTFYAASDPTDSVSVTAHYATYPASAGFLAGPEFRFAPAGPVPADRRAAFGITLPPGRTGRVSLCNASGAPVTAPGDVPFGGRVDFDTSELPAGIYFATLFIDGNPVSTRKIVVVHPFFPR
jgi:hypothetical protein